MCEAYCVGVKNFKKAFELFDSNIQEELLKYLPMGDNYFIGPPGTNQCDCDNKIHRSNDIDSCQNTNNPLFERKINGLHCIYFMDEYYHNSAISLKEHMARNTLMMNITSLSMHWFLK